jgi:hypothetical protein
MGIGPFSEKVQIFKYPNSQIGIFIDINLFSNFYIKAIFLFMKGKIVQFFAELFQHHLPVSGSISGSGPYGSISDIIYVKGSTFVCACVPNHDHIINGFAHIALTHERNVFGGRGATYQFLLPNSKLSIHKSVRKSISQMD